MHASECTTSSGGINCEARMSRTPPLPARMREVPEANDEAIDAECWFCIDDDADFPLVIIGNKQTDYSTHVVSIWRM